VTPDTTTTLHSTRKAVAVPELSGTQTQPHWRTYVRKKLTAISVLIGRLLLVRHRARRDRGRAHGCTRAAHGAYSRRRLELGSSLAGWLARSLNSAPRHAQRELRSTGKPVMVVGCDSPAEILSLIPHGITMFSSTYVVPSANPGFKLCY